MLDAFSNCVNVTMPREFNRADSFARPDGFGLRLTASSVQVPLQDALGRLGNGRHIKRVEAIRGCRLVAQQECSGRRPLANGSAPPRRVSAPRLGTMAP
jgi:hypothetical protein